MEYKRLHPEKLKAAQMEGDFEETMDLLEEQITENLLNVRNSFAEEPSDDPDAAFGYLYETRDTILEYQDIIEEFCELGEELEEIRLDRDLAAEYNIEEDFMSRYFALEEKVERTMKKYSDEYILQELCLTLQERAGRLRISFFGLWLDNTITNRQIDKVFLNYAREIRLGGDPVVIIETIQAKLRAIQERAQSKHEINRENAEAALQELLSILAGMEGVFRESSCYMELLEDSLSERALLKGNHRKTDMESVYYDREILEGDPVEQIKNLVNQVWVITDKLNEAIGSVVNTIIGQEKMTE